MESNMTKRFKIEPDLTCPELAGYKLPPCSRCQEDGVEIESEKYGFRVPYNGSNEFYDKDAIKHFKAGYHKAREKFEFTESDLRQAVALSLDDAEKSVIWSKEWYPNKLADKIIASLRTPIAIEVEMKCGRCYMPLSEDDCWSAKECCQGSEGYPDIPATNPDGTVKGVYVYE